MIWTIVQLWWKLLPFAKSKSQQQHPWRWALRLRLIDHYLSLENLRYWGETKVPFHVFGLRHWSEQSRALNLHWNWSGENRNITDFKKVISTYLLFLGVSQKRTSEWDSCGARSLETPCPSLGTNNKGFVDWYLDFVGVWSQLCANNHWYSDITLLELVLICAH